MVALGGDFTFGGARQVVDFVAGAADDAEAAVFLEDDGLVVVLLGLVLVAAADFAGSPFVAVE